MDIDPVIYTMAGSNLYSHAVTVHKTFAAQMSAMESTGSMGGNVGASREWAASYDATVRDALAMTEMLVGAMGNYADILQQIGYNYALADHLSGSGRAAPKAPATQLPAWQSCVQPPPSAGGPNSGLFEEIGFAVTALNEFGVAIPDGEPDDLQTAADAWSKLASSGNGGLGALPSLLDTLAKSFESETNPDLEYVDEDIRELKGSAESLLALYTELATFCAEHKAAINQLREKLKVLLEELARDIIQEVVEGVIFGVIAGALSAGFGTAAIAAAKAGKIANKVRKYAEKVGGILDEIKFVRNLVSKAGATDKRTQLQRIMDLKKAVSADLNATVRTSRLSDKGLTRTDTDEIIREATRTGSGLKSDKYHRSATFAAEDIESKGVVFDIVGGDGVPRTLVQMPGELNGVSGRFEWILQDGQVTHQMFVKNGTINGKAITP